MNAYVASGGLILGSVPPTVVVMVLSMCIPTLVLGVSPTIVAAWLLEILEVCYRYLPLWSHFSEVYLPLSSL